MNLSRVKLVRLLQIRSENQCHSILWPTKRILDNGNSRLFSIKQQQHIKTERPASPSLVHNWQAKYWAVGLRDTKLYTTLTSSNMAQKIATYDEIKDLPNHPEKILIDVREPNELKETGQIPTSINIPLGTVEENLTLSPEEFKEKYGREISKDTEVIFHCKMGGRAGKATDLASSLGFKNAKNYRGSWTEWANKEGL